MILVDPEAERDVLAAILVRPGAFQDAHGIIDPSSFGEPRHHAIASAIWALTQRRVEPETRAVERELVRQESRGIVGSLLDELVRRRPVAFLNQTRRVRDLGAARKLHRLLFDMTDETTAAQDNPIEWLDEVARRVSAAADVRRDLEFVPMGSLVADHERLLDRRAQGVELGISTGIAAIDAVTGGMHVGEVTIIGARPSCGKSALALQIGNHIAQTEPVVLLSSEMLKMPVLDRVIAETGSINMANLRRGRLDIVERDALREAYERLRRSHADVSDRRGWRVNEIVAQVRTLKRMRCRRRPDGTAPRMTVLLDYLQRILPSHRHHSREREVAEVSETIATMAGEVGCAIGLLVQLGRDAGKRGAEELPILEDIRESGAAEADADNVWFLHRHDRLDDTIEYGATTLAIRKQRQGECGNIPLWFRGQYQRFEYRDRDYVRRGKPEDDKPARPRTKRAPSKPDAKD